ncbi:MAG TPA: PQQ-binding-like beta-propeller repeat protein, partial [Xanthomonadales bacterium]|nr:PQQ-binding-like beta-propeller repeat protein [Xanthomonadales bacterium]
MLVSIRALAFVLLAAAAAPAVADAAPDWEAELRGAPSSRGTVQALVATHGRAIVAGARLAGDKGYVSGFALADGQRAFTGDLLGQHGNFEAWSIVPRAADGGFYLCGTRTADYDYQGFVSRYDASGQRLWTVDTGIDALPQLAQLSDDRIVVAIQLQRWDGTFQVNDGTRLSLLDAGSGQLLARRDARNVRTFIELGAAGGAAYVRGIGTSSLLARFGADLAPGWTRSFDDVGPVGMPQALPGGGLVFPALAYRPELEGRVSMLVALDAASGAERWHADGETVGYNLNDAVSVSVRADSIVYAGGEYRKTELFAVDPATGARRWRVALPLSPDATAIDDTRIYAVLVDEDTDVTTVRAFQRASGAATWSQPQGESDAAMLATDGGRVVAALREDYSTNRWLVRAFDGASGASAPFGALMDEPAQGAAVNDAQGNVYVAGSTIEDDTAVLYVRKHQRATGTVLWERRIPVAEGLWYDIVTPAGIVLAPDGTPIAWANAHNDPAENAFVPHVGRSALYALDRDTGATHWSHLRDGQLPFSALPQVAAVAVSASTAYLEFAWLTDVEDGIPVYDFRIQAVALANGASRWTRQEFFSNFEFPQSIFATKDGLLVSGSRVANAVAGIALYAEADGSVAWSRATGGTLLENARFALVDGTEDAVVATTAVSGGNRRDVVVERFSALTGTSRWSTTFGANNGIHDDPR